MNCNSRAFLCAITALLRGAEQICIHGSIYVHVCHLCMNVLYDSAHTQSERGNLFPRKGNRANPANNRRIRAGEFIAESAIRVYAIESACIN